MESDGAAMVMRAPSGVWEMAPGVFCEVRQPRGSSTSLTFEDVGDSFHVTERGVYHALGLWAGAIGLGIVGVCGAVTSRPPEPVGFWLAMIGVAVLLGIYGVFVMGCFAEASIPKNDSELVWVRRRGWRSRRERFSLADVAVYRARESRDQRGRAAVLRAGEHVMLLKLARTPEQVDAYLSALPSVLQERVANVMADVTIRPFG